MKALLLSFLLMFGVSVLADEIPNVVKTDSKQKSGFLSSGEVEQIVGAIGIIGLGSIST